MNRARDNFQDKDRRGYKACFPLRIRILLLGPVSSEIEREVTLLRKEECRYESRWRPAQHVNDERYTRLLLFCFVRLGAELAGIVRILLLKAAYPAVRWELASGTVPLSSSSSTHRPAEADDATRGDRDFSSDIELDIRV